MTAIADRLPPWVGYFFAIAVTTATLLLRMKIAVAFGHRPLLILFMMPIILSSLLGGFGPGLTATLIAAAGIDYYAIPTLHSFRIAASHDFFQWFIMIFSGILTSVLSEMLHRARQKSEERRLMQERTQEALRISEERFDLAMRGANDGVWDWDMITGEFYLSPRWMEMIGYGDKDIEYRLSVWREIAHPDDRQMVIAKVNDVLEGRSDRFEVEYRLKHRNGHYVDILSRAFPVRDESGRIVRLVGTHVDITDRRKAELEIIALNAELERRVEQRTAELVAANAELESFTYAVSHDLRGPLRAMSGFSNALIEDYGGNLDGQARVYLDQIIEGSRKMGELIDGLLTLSRSTQCRIEREQINLSRVAERLLGEMRASEPEREVECHVEPDLVASGDPVMLESVLENLLSNAWKYTSRKERANIRFFSRDTGSDRVFCVADNGSGFDESYAQKLFEPFQRLHRQEEFPGIGIGLATAYRIIRRHGGTLTASGIKDEGAEFCFSLPDFMEKKNEGLYEKQIDSPC
jgi:PAS domain S-box-containing protein